MAAEDLPDIESQLDALLAEAGLADEPSGGRSDTRASASATSTSDEPEADAATDEAAGAPDDVSDAEDVDEPAFAAAADEVEGRAETSDSEQTGSLAHEIDDMIAEGESAAYDDREADASDTDEAAAASVDPPAAEVASLDAGEEADEASAGAGRDAADEAFDDEILGDIQSLDEALDEMLDEDLGGAEQAAGVDSTDSEPAQGDEPAERGAAASARPAPPQEPPGEVTLPASADPDAFDPDADIDTADLEFEDPDEAEADGGRYEAAAKDEGSAAAVAEELEADQAQQRGSYTAAEPTADDPRDDPTRYVPPNESETRSDDSRDESTDRAASPSTLLQTIVLLIVQVLAVLNRPLRPLSPQNRDIVGYIGVQTLCVSIGLLAVVAWGGVIAISIIAALGLVAAYLFYLLFVRSPVSGQRA